MHRIFFIIGASGAGKTAAIRELKKSKLPRLKIFYFDRIGVPSSEEMTRLWGSGEAWQRAMTNRWVEKMREELRRADIILDGQTRPSFIVEACRRHNIDRFEIILLDCSDDIRKARLIERGHADLANEQMMDWARYLRDETQRVGGRTVNNDNLSIQETADALRRLFLMKPEEQRQNDQAFL